MHVAVVSEIQHTLIPALKTLRDELDNCAKKFNHIIKIGRTHLQVITISSFYNNVLTNF